MRDRQQYDTAFQLVRAAVAQWDPFRLIGGGAPADEWDQEVALLLTRLQTAHSPEEAVAAVAEVFGESLGAAVVDAASCRAFGRSLWERLVASGFVTRGGSVVTSNHVV